MASIVTSRSLRDGPAASRSEGTPTTQAIGALLVRAHGAVTRLTPVRLRSATGLTDAALFEFFDVQHSLYARRPSTLRIQRTDAGADQALEIETLEGQFIRLAFRSSALPEQLDGLAPGEACLDERSCVRSFRS